MSTDKLKPYSIPVPTLNPHLQTLGYFKIQRIHRNESSLEYFDINLMLEADPTWTPEFTKLAVDTLGFLAS